MMPDAPLPSAPDAAPFAPAGKASATDLESRAIEGRRCLDGDGRSRYANVAP
jgi:hypothetical protein